jgi:hypothetical protein
VHLKDWWGKEMKKQKSDGSEVPMTITVPRRICMKGDIETVDELRQETKSAITACKRIGAEGEMDALNDVKNELEKGRDKGVRDVVHEDSEKVVHHHHHHHY